MKLAAIDLGSNSLRLLVARRINGRLDVIHRGLKETRLGEGLQQGRELLPQAVERNLAALREFYDELMQHNAHYILALGTSALREAKDGQSFLQRVEEEIGIPTVLLSSKEEAYLGFMSASLSFPGQSGSMVVIDAGGRSTEISWQQEESFCFTSLPVGAVKLQENFIEEDPPSAEDMLRLDRYLESVLAALPRGLGRQKGHFLVGIGGTITTLAAIHYKLDEYLPSRLQGQQLTRGDLEKVISYLSAMPLAERKKVPGLPPQRADIIIPGAVALLRCMERMAFTRLLVNQGGFLLAALQLLAATV